MNDADLARLSPRTVATLGQLEGTWFQQVGQAVNGPFVCLASWADAIEACSSAAWDDLLLEAANQYAARVSERNAERFEHWNAIIDLVKPVSTHLVRLKIADVMRIHKLPQVFEDCVQWDILHLCMEAEYSDVYPPGFFASQGFWYMRGHFPCGWLGEFPAGQLIVY